MFDSHCLNGTVDHKNVRERLIIADISSGKVEVLNSSENGDDVDCADEEIEEEEEVDDEEYEDEEVDELHIGEHSDGHEYDDESSDFDDTDLLQRLDDKYGKLQQQGEQEQPQLSHSDDDAEDTDPTWTSIKHFYWAI